MPFRLSGVDTSKDMTPAAVEQAVIRGQGSGNSISYERKGICTSQRGFEYGVGAAPKCYADRDFGERDDANGA